MLHGHPRRGICEERDIRSNDAMDTLDTNSRKHATPPPPVITPQLALTCQPFLLVQYCGRSATHWAMPSIPHAIPPKMTTPSPLRANRTPCILRHLQQIDPKEGVLHNREPLTTSAAAAATSSAPPPTRHHHHPEPHHLYSAHTLISPQSSTKED
jgi:hypothetical protein